MQHTPLCYSSASSRFSMLRGKWTRNQSHRPTYSNLSCALEWSKYCNERWYGTEDPKKHRTSTLHEFITANRENIEYWEQVRAEERAPRAPKDSAYVPTRANPKKDPDEDPDEDVLFRRDKDV